MGKFFAKPTPGVGKLLLPQNFAATLSVLLVLLGLALSFTSDTPEAIIPPSVSSYSSGPNITAAAKSVDCEQVKCIALTFDDGPNYLTTPKILKILESRHIHASFFIVGSRVAGSDDILQRMYRDGDEIGNHSWNHPDFTTLSAKQIKQQIDRTQRAIVSAGVPAPTLFRPPYGAVDAKVRANVPLTIMFWNEDPVDWGASSANQIAASVLKHAKPGGVVDMHDIYERTADALPKIIHELKKRHYHFVTVSHLLTLHSGQPGEYYGRYLP